MNTRLRGDRDGLNHPGRRSRRTALAAICLLITLMALLFLRKGKNPNVGPASADTRQATANTNPERVSDRLARVPNRPSTAEPALTATQVVNEKVSQFARSRRQLAHAISEHYKARMPDAFERFFDAAEAGRYEEMETIY